MKRILFTTLILILISVANCWQTVGFRINDHELVKEYLLPDWGYSRIKLDLSGYGKLHREDLHYYHKDLFQTYDVSFSPSYLSSYESEKFNYFLQFNSQSSLHYLETENSNKQIGRDYSQSNYLSGRFDYYLNRNHYISTTLSSNYRYYESNDTYDPNDRLMRSLDSELFIGYGIGRIRDVSPVFKALRLRERIEALNKGLSLTEDQLEKISEKFALYPQFVNVYDRYEKYFWAEISPELGSKFDDLTMAETLYLTEVMQEYIKRYQGYEVIIGIEAQQNYENNQYKNYNLTDEEVNEFYFGPSLRFEWIHNFNLKYQIGFSSDLSYLFEFSENNEFLENISELIDDEIRQNNHLNFSFSNNHYYQITDRFIWQGSVNFEYSYIWLEDIVIDEDSLGINLVLDDMNGYDLNAEFNTSLEYYLENNFSLSFQLNSYVRHISEEISDFQYLFYGYQNLMRNERLTFYFGCNYYFNNPF